ncbi:MAG: aspartate kinase [Defluviitaleaceae bacterium]|nr:aspartate kinase [Defluviitaleaceae bacterium]
MNIEPLTNACPASPNHIVVQKFGGSSVASPDRIMNVARRIAKTYEAGHSVVVVLSAQGNTTDHLYEKAREINPNANKRELDMLLTTGEQQSVALMAMALQSMGLGAVSLNAAQVGIRATDSHGNAHIEDIETARMLKELSQNKIVLVAGFQGINHRGDLTTLGRGASDTTAVAIAAVLGAKACEIYSDVDGIYTVDPRIVPTAKRRPALGYDEMLELAFAGVQMLHGRAVEMAKRYGVQIVVRSSMEDSEGTWIKENAAVEQLSVSGIAIDRNVARISLLGLQDEPGAAFQIFSLSAKAEISVDIILRSVAHGDTCDISFTVQREDLQRAQDLLEVHKQDIGYQHMDVHEGLAKVSIVGAGMATNHGVAAAMFEALYQAGVNIHMISTSEIKIAVLVDERQVSQAANAIHEKFDHIFEGKE